MTTAPESKEATETLYAGKFKTVQELEAGYKNSLPVFQENENLKKKFEEVTKVPDDYQTPEDIGLHQDDVVDIKKIAKNSGLTQAQFEKLARETQTRTNANSEKFEAAKKELGADNLNLVQDFINKQYGEKVAKTLIKDVIMNKELREDILAQRSKALNSNAPGMNRASGSGNYSITHKDVLAVREEMMKARGKARVEAQARYVSISAQYATQNQTQS